MDDDGYLELDEAKERASTGVKEYKRNNWKEKFSAMKERYKTEKAKIAKHNEEAEANPKSFRNRARRASKRIVRRVGEKVRSGMKRTISKAMSKKRSVKRKTGSGGFDFMGGGSSFMGGDLLGTKSRSKRSTSGWNDLLGGSSSGFKSPLFTDRRSKGNNLLGGMGSFNSPLIPKKRKGKKTKEWWQ